MRNASDRSFKHIKIQIFPAMIKVWRNLAESVSGVWLITPLLIFWFNHPPTEHQGPAICWLDPWDSLLTWSPRLFISRPLYYKNQTHSQIIASAFGFIACSHCGCELKILWGDVFIKQCWLDTQQSEEIIEDRFCFNAGVICSNMH